MGGLADAPLLALIVTIVVALVFAICHGIFNHFNNSALPIDI
jgi:hypothetical protein